MCTCKGQPTDLFSPKLAASLPSMSWCYFQLVMPWLGDVVFLRLAAT